MIAETNYCAHAIEDLRRYSKHPECRPDVRGLCAMLVAEIEQSVKFKMPDCGDLLGWQEMNPPRELGELIATYAQPFRLPYETIAIEYSVRNNPNGAANFDASVVVAKQIGDAISISYASRATVNGLKVWAPGDFGCSLYADGGIGYGGLIPDAQAILDSLHTWEAKMARIGDEMGWEIRAVVQLVAALACRNVAQRVIHPSSAINKKRARSGKQPFYSYRILEIGEGDQAAESGAGGSHASPRVHLRRGHIRRLPDRNVWVNACVVGNKAMGMVTKDYAFRSDSVPKIAERMH
jgi:hypothetical protein